MWSLNCLGALSRRLDAHKQMPAPGLMVDLKDWDPKIQRLDICMVSLIFLSSLSRRLDSRKPMPSPGLKDKFKDWDPTNPKVRHMNSFSFFLFLTFPSHRPSYPNTTPNTQG